MNDPGCYSCGISYLDQGFHDLVVPNYIWREISPTRDEGGLLCPNCILKALEAAGIKDCPAAFMSGPIRTVSPELMEVIRWVENIREELERREAAK